MSDRPPGPGAKFIVGVTGNIATGKSAVMRLAAEQGALTIDADKLVHQIMDEDADTQAAIAVAFGPGVRRPDGRIDRGVLGDIVFNDPDAMSDLEGMIHPAVYAEVTRRINESAGPLVFIEAIKLLEGRLAEECQQIWVTRCSRQCQLDRLRICRGVETAVAAARIKAQPPQEEKVARADVVIDTDGYMKDTARQVETAWKRLPDWAKIRPLPFQESPIKPKAAAVPTIQPGQGPGVTVSGSTAQGYVQKGASPLLKIPKPKQQTVAVARSRGAAVAISETEPASTRPENMEVRRARPSDIPSILLLIQKATHGAVKMKRADLLMAFSERSYLIGQLGAEVNAIMGWSIDSQVARIDQIFIHPPEVIPDLGLALLEEVEASAEAHICEIIIAFLSPKAEAALHRIFELKGFDQGDRDSLPGAWRTAIDESQPEDSLLLVKILRDERLKRAQVS
jgi:dephospho-CoA kinase